MLYTRKGDKGKTGLFHCDQRISKSSVIAEALGTLDELNSFLGLCKSQIRCFDFTITNINLSQIIHQVQKNLFIIQARVAGANKHFNNKKIKEIEKIISACEKTMPPIKTFFIPGATEMSAFFDVARTLARRTERQVVRVEEEGVIKISSDVLSYLNRLSSLLYALARLSAYKSGIKEAVPDYK